MPNTRPTNRRGHRTGFTLVEIMIALGVMGVALGMAAAAFEAGIKSHTSSVADAMRSLIAENAIAIAQARLAHGRTPTADLSTTASRPQLGPKDCSYPVNTASGRGFVLVGKQMATATNDYSFTIKPYLLSRPDYLLGTSPYANLWVADSGSSSAILDILSIYDLQILMPVGTWVMAVNPSNGDLKMARIVAVTKGQATTDVPMFTASRISVTTMLVKDANGTAINNASINFLSDYTVRTSLRPAP